MSKRQPAKKRSVTVWACAVTALHMDEQEHTFVIARTTLAEMKAYRREATLAEWRVGPVVKVSVPRA